MRFTTAVWAWRAAAAVGALALAVLIGARGLAASLAESRPDEALRIAPGFEPAVVALAQQRLKAGRIGEAEHLARAAVRDDPLDVDAAVTLGLAFADEGRASQAEALMTLAASRSWRNSLAHAWLFERRLAQGRLIPALDDADSLLRRDESGDLRNRVFAILDMIAADDDARPSLVARLAEGPPWRGAFLQTFAEHASDPGSVEAVFAALRASPRPPAASEAAPLVNRLTADKRYGDALAEWQAAQPPARRGGLLRDGDFAGAADGTAFAWSPEEGPGASAGPEAAPSVAGRALRVEYDGYSTPTLPQQMLVLPAGAYSLRWRELAAEGGGANALAWTVRCADDGRLLARSRAAVGAGGWTDAQLTFETRPPGCAAQWLQLAASPGERRTTIVRWYGGLRLERLP